MKKITLTFRRLAIALCVGGSLISLPSFAQFEFGAEGSLASCWILNKNVSDAGNSQNYGMALSYNYGLHVAVDFTDHFGLVGNLLWGTYNQKYTGTFQSDGFVMTDNFKTPQPYFKNQTYKSTTTLTTMDIPVMVRFQTNSSAFVELGLQYSMINGATFSAAYSSPNGSYNPDVKSYFGTSNLQGLLGFGSNFRLNDSWFIIADFRVAYGFSDIKGVDALGQNLNKDNSLLYTSSGSTPAYYSSYQPTNTITGSFTLGIYYYLETNFTHHTGHQRCKGPAKARG